MDSFGLTVREVQALAKDGNCVRVVRQKLLVEHNDVAAQHDLMTPEERMGLARRSIKDVQITTALRLLREAIRAGNATEGTSSRRYMGRTPTESLHLTNEMRSCALSALSLKDSAFNERLKLVLLYEEDFTRLMAIFAAAREHARQKQAQPKLFLKHVEGLVGKVDLDSLRQFFTLVENGTLKLSDAMSYGTRVQVRQRKFQLSHIISVCRLCWL